MPIEDSLLLFNQGSPKEARWVHSPCGKILSFFYCLQKYVGCEDIWLIVILRFFPGQQHMGYPFSNGSVYPWLEKVMAR